MLSVQSRLRECMLRMKYPPALYNEPLVYLLSIQRRNGYEEGVQGDTHFGTRQTDSNVIQFLVIYCTKKERDIKTAEINEKALSVWWMEAQWGRSRATTENRDNTCDTRAKEKESRSVRWLSGYASCLAASKQDSPHPRGRWWARVHLILEWFGPRALSLCSLYVVLPFLDTRWKSPAYLFRYRERASVFLSLSFSVYIVHIFPSLFLSLLRSPTHSVLLLSSLLLHARFAFLSSSSSPRLSSLFVHRIQHRDV